MPGLGDGAPLQGADRPYVVLTPMVYETMRTDISSRNTEQEIRSRLIHWYARNRRSLPWRETADPYRIWVSEVMLQQTRVNTVIPYYHKFLGRFPDIERLAGADLQDVLKAWEGMGYYGRARNLHRAAERVCRDFGGRIPDQWEEFRDLPGVGDYIAAAVLSIAFQKPYAVADGNAKRVLARVFLMDEPVNDAAAHRVFRELAGRLLDPVAPGTFNQALMELGATVCLPRHPACPECSIRTECEARERDRTDQYPKRIRKKHTPEYEIGVGVVFKGDRVLITRRQPEGLLGGLWEFPGGKVLKGETPEQACVREIREEVNLSVEVLSFLTTVRHAYTHFRIRMHVFCCRFLSGRVRLNGPEDHRWIRLTELDRYPFPKANHKFMARLKGWAKERDKD
jgi:A/G-specific adenine glycosylase